VYDNATAFPEGDRRPLTLGATTRIIDYVRGDSAFVPGYQFDTVPMPNWTNNDNTLQKNKQIELQGIPPRITSAAVTIDPAKTVYTTAAPNGYYVKTGETVILTLTADNNIRANGAPVLRYSVTDFNTGTVYGPFTTQFKYKQPGTVSNQLIFSLPITEANFTYNGTFRDGVRITNISLIQADGIKDYADNNIVPATVSDLNPATAVYVKQRGNTRPDMSLSAAASNPTASNPLGTNPNSTLYYNTNPTLTIDGIGIWQDRSEYSTNGGMSWSTYNAASKPPLSNGTYVLAARVVDRAGNNGEVRQQSVQINGNFPKLVTVNATQANGWYTANPGNNSLTFNLNFEDEVRFTAATRTNVSIRLRDKTINTNNPAGVSPSYEITLNPDTAQQNTYSTSIRFSWTSITGKEMPNGLYISDIILTGLSDRFGNTGGQKTGILSSSPDIIIDSNTTKNLPNGGLKVDAIAPTFTLTPLAQGVSSDNKTIILTFNEAVMIGSGMITVKPHGDYKIPAVLENNGRYDSNGTYIAGFYDIYNNSALTAADRQTLTLSKNAANPSMSNLELDTRSGQSAGPYIKLTHGLKEGPGFSGDYSSAGADAPSMGGTYMVPDTATKWVLDYRYSIDNNSNTQYGNTAATYALVNADTSVVPAIRAVLTKAKWRWQEIELVNAKFSNDDKTVTITLNETLLKGLQWDLVIPKGSFTDLAGNDAEAVPGTYWFWSNGVQNPVIRVNRKSFDARTANWSAYNGTTFLGRAYSVPNDLGGPGGWGIGDFNTVHYRIESETPGASIRYRTETGSTGNNGSITGAWTGNISGTGATERTWDNPSLVGTTITQSNGDWVLPNLVRRNRVNATGGTGTTGSYTVTENGFSTTRNITARYQGYRSYNRDISKGTLTGGSLSAFSGTGGNATQGSFTYSALQASKNYVIADAQITNGGTQYTSDRSYEGVFRSVVMLKQDEFGGNLNGANFTNNLIMVQGSNVKNGMPSISGFPVYDAGETGDNRFIKIFYYAQRSGPDNAMTGGRLYWVSTEIISQWYFLACGYHRTNNTNSGGTHSQEGDVNNYLFSGYGDLTFARNLR